MIEAQDVDASLIDVPLDNSLIDVPVDNSLLDLPAENSLIDAPVDSSAERIAIAGLISLAEQAELARECDIYVADEPVNEVSLVRLEWSL